MKHISMFKTELPNMAHFEELILDSQRLDDAGNPKEPLMCKPCGDYSVMSFGFNPNTPVLKTGSGFCLQFKFETKSIPAKVIKKLVDQKIAAIKLEDPEAVVTKKERDVIREEVYQSLLPNYIAVDDYVRAYYHEKSGTLILNTSTDNKTGTILAFLRRILGSLQTTTLHVDGISNNLTKNVAQSLENDDGLGFQGFSFADSLHLKNSDDDKVQFQGDYELDTVLSLIHQGYEVVKAQLSRDGLTFTLTSELKITGVTLDDWHIDGIKQEVDDEMGEDVDAAIVAEQQKFLEEQTQVELLVAIGDDLVTFFSELINVNKAA